MYLVSHKILRSHLCCCRISIVGKDHNANFTPLLVFIFLAATQNELKKEHNRPLLRRMYIVTSETMSVKSSCVRCHTLLVWLTLDVDTCRLPPALLALGIFISFELHGVTLLSMDRAMFWMMSDMLFLAVLHSLVA